MTHSHVIENARNIHGRSWKQIAGLAGVTTVTLLGWRKLETQVPEHKWQGLARALGIEPGELDRATYLAEFAPTAPQEAPKAPTAPQEAPEAPTAPQEARAGWFDVLKDDDPEPAPSPKRRGWFAETFLDDGEEYA